jgi:lipooligosaccharide transport system permease protein
MITQAVTTSAAVAIAERHAGRPGAGFFAGRPYTPVLRNYRALRTTNMLTFLTGFVEPVIYLLAFGYGVGALIDSVTVAGVEIPYIDFIAPALLASSAMMGAIMDSTFNVFFKMHYMKIYHTMMSTSLGPLDVALGEIGWAMIRGAAYAVGFTVVAAVFGVLTSWWALLMIPAAVLVAFAFASIGMSITSYMKSFHQLNWLNFVLLPLFLFSGTFFPITLYPDWLQAIIMVTPLWQAIAMMRSIAFGIFDGALVVHIVYFLVIAAVGLVFTSRRLEALFLR